MGQWKMTRSALAVLLSGLLFLAPDYQPASAQGSERPKVIFVHGVGVPSLVYEHIPGLRSLFAKQGYAFAIARTPAVANLEKASAVLAKEISRLAPEGSFHLVAHSMGGLIARKTIADYKLGGRCLSLGSIAVPHQGSKVADWILAGLGEGGFEAQKAKLLMLMFGKTPEIVKELSTAYAQRYFNPAYPPDPAVAYYSMGFYVTRPALLVSPNVYVLVTGKINDRLGSAKNDGPVSLESSRFGEHLGDFPGDHYAETAPLPFAGRIIYLDVFKRILAHLEKLDGKPSAAESETALLGMLGADDTEPALWDESSQTLSP